MNKDRRKEIAAAIERLSELAEMRDSIQEDLEAIRGDETDYLENMPEGLRYGSERGQAAEEAVSSLDDAISTLEDIDTDSIIASLEEASA